MSSSSTSTSETSTTPESVIGAGGSTEAPGGEPAHPSADQAQDLEDAIVAEELGDAVVGEAGGLREPEEIELEALGDALAGIVTATSGVLRIEPTLRGAVQAWRSGDGDDPAQHLELTVRGTIVDVVDVAVHVAVAADHQARLLAHRLRERLQVHLTDRGLVPGTVEISILTIEPTLT